MKHLKKKFILYIKAGEELASVLDNAPANSEVKPREILQSMDGNYAIVYTDDNELLQTFKYEENNELFLIPEYNPITIYFDTARYNMRQLRDARPEVFTNSAQFGHGIRAVNGNFYQYFALASSYSLFLFTALEAFINKMIPPNYEYRRKIQDKKTELFDKDQIQRNIDFIEKIKFVIPQIKKANFITQYSHKYDQILKLKQLRDEIAHTKTYNGKNAPNYYEKLFATTLSFDYETTLHYVKDYINFYEPSLIEECDCGREE